MNDEELKEKLRRVQMEMDALRKRELSNEAQRAAVRRAAPIGTAGWHDSQNVLIAIPYEVQKEWLEHLKRHYGASHPNYGAWIRQMMQVQAPWTNCSETREPTTWDEMVEVG